VGETKTIALEQPNIFVQKLSDYAMLAKFRLSFLVVFSAVIGYLFASPAFISVTNIFLLALGGMLVTGASNAINQIIERDIDKLMTRTQSRPLPTERMNMLEAILAAGAMGISGIIILTYFFNPTAGVLSDISLFGYSFVYTPFKSFSFISAVIFFGLPEKGSIRHQVVEAETSSIPLSL